MGKYKMTISLNVLNHLGINLYSNIPSVLSEIVANAWDADAKNVIIDIDKGKQIITITDDGNGMNEEDVNNKYLHVGYQKRNASDYTPLTKLGRLPMGRKGIGKLSVFSIADHVEVYSVKDGSKNGFIMDANEIKRIVEGDKDSQISYEPQELPLESINIEKGTKIILKSIKKNIRSLNFSRRRLARRFSVIGDEHNFNVVLNGEPISIKDRDYFDKIQFVWYLGPESEKFASLCKKASNKTKLTDEFNYDNETTYKVSGWIGTFKEHGAGDEEEDTNKIILFARGKLIKEDLLPEFKEGRMFSKYLIGEIEADFMDEDQKSDIVTSDRQRILETDDRWEIFQDFFKHQILNKIGKDWTNFRNKTAIEEATKNESINNWFSSLKGDNKEYAKLMFQKIEGLKSADDNTKKELYRSSILAFEKLALSHNLSKLKDVNERNIKLLINLFRDIDDIEGTHYYQITKGRLNVLEKFKSLMEPETKEKVLQEYLFEHLWLLHPSWDRATADSHMEVSINKVFDSEYISKAGLTDEQLKGRFDIKYRTASGKHIIIELKRYKRKVDIDELISQVSKYRRTLEKCLKAQFPESPRDIEIICLLGSPPSPEDEYERNVEKLRTENARYITYDSLINESLASYKDYLSKQQDISRILKIINEI